jgi:shikimate kinase
MIFFIGMPGSGKSFWASTLAAAQGLPFIDLDVYFEEKEKMTIADYFDKYGEEAFRVKEKEALHEIISNKDATYVVACGGGTPAFFDNMEAMKKAGCTIYLTASMDSIVQRLEHSPTRRPLLEGRDIREGLRELYDRRHPFFSQADYIFDVENISVANFEKIIPSCINKH